MNLHLELDGLWHPVDRNILMAGLARGDIATKTQVWDGRLMRTAGSLLPKKGAPERSAAATPKARRHRYSESIAAT